jgi:hypothetical protein
MLCERCGGLMVSEMCCDLLMETESRDGNKPIRCLNCGNVEDLIIRTNRVLSRLPRHGEPHTVETRRSSAMQPRSLEQAIPTEGVTSEYRQGRAPRLPVGPPSANTRTCKSAHNEHPTPIVQTQRRYA